LKTTVNFENLRVYCEKEEDLGDIIRRVFHLKKEGYQVWKIFFLFLCQNCYDILNLSSKVTDSSYCAFSTIGNVLMGSKFAILSNPHQW